MTNPISIKGVQTSEAGLQAWAVRLTANASADWLAVIPVWTSFASVTSNTVTHIIVLPPPVLGNVLYIKEVWTTGFEIKPNAYTNYINGTVCTPAKTLAMAGNTGVAVFVCVVGGSAGKWLQYRLDDDGTLDSGGTPD